MLLFFKRLAAGALAAAGSAEAPAAWAVPAGPCGGMSMMSSTRRLAARPAAVSLPSIGRVSA